MTPRRLRIVLPVLALLATAPVATDSAAKAKRDPAIARGHDVARRACAVCHAVDVGGKSAQPRAPSFASQELQHVAALEGRVAMLTREGHYGMSPVALTAAEIADLQAYIASLERRRAKP